MTKVDGGLAGPGPDPGDARPGVDGGDPLTRHVATDRNEKSDAYGSMGVGWLWLVDPDRSAVETYANVRGRITAGPVFQAGEEITGEPFGSVTIPVEAIFVRES